eukprot:scaffold4064_cov23-Cyclotella_meneghiniana.AAC.1
MTSTNCEHRNSNCTSCRSANIECSGSISSSKHTKQRLTFNSSATNRVMALIPLSVSGSPDVASFPVIADIRYDL